MGALIGRPPMPSSSAPAMSDSVAEKEHTSSATAEAGGEREGDRRSWISLGLTALVLGGLVVAYFAWPAFQEHVNEAYDVLTSGDRARIEEWVGQFGPWGPVAVVLTMVLQMFLIVIPSWGLMIVNVLAFGPVGGALLSVAGIAAASSLGYFIGHHLHETTIDHIVGAKTSRKMEGYVDDYGLWAVFVARLAPFLSNDAISFIGGLVQMGYWKFLGATLAGIAPLTVLIAALGNDVDQLKTGLIVASAVCLVLFVGYVVYDRQREGKR